MQNSAFDDVFAGIADAFHDVFGVSGSYTPVGESAVDISVLVEDLVETRANNQTGGRGKRWELTAIILASDVATPQRGDRFQFTNDERVFVVTANPTRTDNAVDWVVDLLSTETTEQGDVDITPEF